MSVLQQYIAGVAYEDKPVVTASNTSNASITNTNAVGATTSNSSSTESFNSAPIIEKSPVPVLPPPPGSFLFLPGTVLLPQPKGGLYNPTLKKIPTDTGVKVAKYKNN
jgi:hypothetical protein